jgi:type IV secretory pathway VirJ component
MALTIYRPVTSSSSKGTVIMGSGDVGWVGLAVSTAEFLRGNGYIVVGVNARQYLGAFTTNAGHLTPEDVGRDYNTIAEYLRAHQLLRTPTVVSGVSEGAALAVLAAADPANHSWIDGVVTIGLPPSAELAWRWYDFRTWITKKDAGEPSVSPRAYLASVSPLPLVMIQSKKDEYVSEADYRDFDASARPPKRLVLIEASNHRFTDRIPELRRELMAALSWISSGIKLAPIDRPGK